MEFVIEKIYVPNNHSFISRELPLSRNARIHSHKNFELNFITSGEGRRIVGDNISQFEKGDLVLLGPELPHCWEFVDNDENEKATCIVTHFSENIVDSNFFKIPELEKVVDLLKKATRGVRFKTDNNDTIYHELQALTVKEGLEYFIGLLKVFNYLLLVEEWEVLSKPVNRSSVFSKNVEKINKIYEYVFQSIQDGVKLEEAASVLNMAPSSFCRFFKKKTGQTFMEYVKNVRVGIAAKLLAETDKQITQICFESGYNNLANFNHYFKASMGKTPSEYRKNFR
ncbi:AraC family transcriptional regulator [Pseudozobellia sp. WGM2]|uniref:AraC family transcriptional regulator n=1 Tax=Pseudozobellia sp. WGM2 TaxID=2787625 RepID=UPI001ADFB1BC|nr:AraC family transcriptional regulator [Pseudozobellia sp. WGM2]